MLLPQRRDAAGLVLRASGMATRLPVRFLRAPFGTMAIGAIFVFFFYALQSHPAVVFDVYLLPKSTVLNARARNPNSFFLRLLSRHSFLPAASVAVVPTIRTIFSLTRLVVVDKYHIYGMQQFCIGGCKCYFYMEAIRR
jgi:hypothetical protein